MKTPIIRVGIMTKPVVVFSLHGRYKLAGTDLTLTGTQTASLQQGKLCFQDKHYTSLLLEPQDEQAFFELEAVTIGVDFHWERQENQSFQGALRLETAPEGLLVINEIDIESYLLSVISSEMSAQASKELLKAHAVISRSWLLAQIGKSETLREASRQQQSCFRTEEELMRWYDREDHIGYDVCADDHCQRYQGISRNTTQKVTEAVRETAGEVIMYQGTLCDARFSKCCGGVTETFEHCWEPEPHPYLKALRDATETDLPDLTHEMTAENWIRTSPDAFCNTADKSILSQVLNNYDQETTRFYRWQIRYTQQELAALIQRKSDIDFGLILDLIPLSRGTSGRIDRLQIIGTSCTYIIGKELEIRRTLSESHLYSSAFVVDKVMNSENIPEEFIFTGAGWGHGVGLCQIGAAVMGSKGYAYTAILNHYFPDTEIIRKY